LVFIGTNSEELRTQALTEAARAIKENTTNTKLLAEVLKKLHPDTEGLPEEEQGWIDETNKACDSQQSSLELQLNHELANQNQDGIREAHFRLGEFYYRRGELDQSHKAFLRAREFSTQNAMIVKMCCSVVRVTLESKKYNHVLSYCAKAESLRPDADIIARLNCSAGLALLDRGSYSGAATRFLTAAQFDPDVMSEKDGVTYSVLCALATFSRSDLKSRVLDNKKFRERLDAEPLVREMLLDFYGSKYSSCLQYLDRIEERAQFDIHLHDHIKPLKAKIRHKAILQYFSPFAAVELGTMAKAFNSDVPTIEKEVAALIMENQLDGKIDSHNKILYATEGEKRRTAFRHAVRLAESYEENTHALIVRVNLMKNSFYVKPARMQMAGMGGGISNMQDMMLQMMGLGGL